MQPPLPQQQQHLFTYGFNAFESAPIIEPDERSCLSSFLADSEQVPVTEPPGKRTRSSRAFDSADRIVMPKESSRSSASIGRHDPAAAHSTFASPDAFVPTPATSYDPTLALASAQLTQMDSSPEYSTEAAAGKNAEAPKASRNTQSCSEDDKTLRRPGKVRRGGRQSDPRMSKAIAAKMNHDNLSLREALEAGGFVFPPKTSSRRAASTVIDNEGVTLAQRKNQLSRRLRKLKKRKEGDDADKGRRKEEEDYKGKNADESLLDFEADDINTSVSSDLKAAASASENIQSDSDNDSFFNMVNELPGIKDM